jgi:hypothetical protein
MKSVYKRIVDVISDSSIVVLSEEMDCDKNVLKHLKEEAKIKAIVDILKKSNYLNQKTDK